MPELPEVEAWVRELDPLVSRSPIEKAGPAHIATLKTADAAARPSSTVGASRARAVAGRTSSSRSRTTDLVLRVHLMSAGRLRYLSTGEKRPKTPMFRLRFADGGELVLTEGGKKKRAGVWLVTQAQLDADLGHLGPDALDLDAAALAEILDARAAAAPPAPPRPARDRRHRPRALPTRSCCAPGSRRSRRRRSSPTRRSSASQPRCTTISTRALELREQGKGDSASTAIHNRLGEPCPQCGTPIARVDFEEHTIYYCPSCQTGGRLLKDRRLSRLLR